MNVVVLDNYDSFTYNLVHLIEKIIHTPVRVFRNDEIALETIQQFDKIVLSPGPGLPSEAGLLLPVIQQYAATKSILGVCLGHQAIGEVFGAKLENLSQVFHGVATSIHILHAQGIFQNLPSYIEAGRYHSWIVSKDNFPHEALEITAEDEQGFIMAMHHKLYDITGVQFHPESVLTPMGETILRNWLHA